MKECKIVQDLLPSYIEKLTSKDTNEYIEGHLKTCENCTNVYNDMKAEIKVNTTSPKAEIDYMKKVRKKMRIAEKLLYIILLLFIIFVLVFWREIFSFICYTDICNRYLKYQEEVFETKKYSVYHKNNESYIDTYKMPNLAVNKSRFLNSDNIIYTAIQGESDIQGVKKLIHNTYKTSVMSEEDEITNSVIIYMNLEDNFENEEAPFYPNFSFDKKSNFWELMSTFSYIRNIRIVDENYEIDFREGGTKGYLYRGEAFIYKEGEDKYTLRVGEVSEKDIEKGLTETENTILCDYSASNRNTSENLITKLSKCEKEAGSVVAYDFKIPKEESSSLKYLSEAYNFDDISSESTTKIERLREIAVMNNATYKKFQERWSGLRDLTDEDFINYTAIIMVDIDNSKELHYKNIEHNGDFVMADIYMEETESKDDYQYSGCLLLVPNHMLYNEDGSNRSHDYFIHIVNN